VKFLVDNQRPIARARFLDSRGVLAGATATSARLIWIRLGNCRKRELLAAIERLWSRVEERLVAGDRIIEVR
jgi:predicted nuclease of predicted toxin-antitoxin system